MAHKLDGCCSAVKPCSWQLQDPWSLCPACRDASLLGLPPAMRVPIISDADLAYLAGLAISSKDTTLARIAAALLLAR